MRKMNQTQPSCTLDNSKRLHGLVCHLFVSDVDTELCESVFTRLGQRWTDELLFSFTGDLLGPTSNPQTSRLRHTRAGISHAVGKHSWWKTYVATMKSSLSTSIRRQASCQVRELFVEGVTSCLASLAEPQQVQTSSPQSFTHLKRCLMNSITRTEMLQHGKATQAKSKTVREPWPNVPGTWNLKVLLLSISCIARMSGIPQSLLKHLGQKGFHRTTVFPL